MIVLTFLLVLTATVFAMPLKMSAADINSVENDPTVRSFKLSGIIKDDIAEEIENE